jgi:hypothetical protein
MRSLGFATEDLMRKEFGQLDGDQSLKDHLALYGMCTGDMVVEAGGELHLYGMCAGNIEIKSDGALCLYGMCTGHVINSGGRVEISGMVVGNVEKKGGSTTILPTARVGMAP